MRTTTDEAARQLIDGHGRDIGDVRISVTDRCNFRCQYCMPAEGLPWLDRDDSSPTRRSRGSSALLASMGVHDVRLTGGEPLARRELWRLVELLSADENVHDLVADHQRLPARAPGREAGAAPACAA